MKPEDVIDRRHPVAAATIFHGVLIPLFVDAVQLTQDPCGLVEATLVISICCAHRGDLKVCLSISESAICVQFFSNPDGFLLDMFGNHLTVLAL